MPAIGPIYTTTTRREKGWFPALLRYDAGMSPSPPEESPGYVRRRLTRWREGVVEVSDDHVADERPVELVYNGQSFAVMMATPQDLDDFALGFSLSEGLIVAPSQLLDVEIRPLLEGIQLALRVHEDAPGAKLDGAAQRILPGRSGCGLCGSRQLEDVVRQPAPVEGDISVTPSDLERALLALQQRQPINAVTGAVHAAAWGRAGCDVVLVREDVGRHNALDKLIGALHHAGIDPASGFALITSRASYEMTIKAASAGITVLAAISAPTALAIELARSAGLTLIGFTRAGSFNVYCCPERLHGAAVPGGGSALVDGVVR